MSFGKSRRQLSQSTNYNPPPGYYHSSVAPKFIDEQANCNFAKDARWKQYPAKFQTPGPGEYHPMPDVRKRLLEQGKKKEQVANFKINSIPSIPRHTTAGIYEELAPGILVMHQIEEENGGLGPGSYEPKPVIKKVEAHKFHPEHQKKFIDLVPEGPTQVEQQLEKMKEVARQQRRILQAKQLYKKSPVQSLINPPDVCLELIILRERQMKAAEVPAPGYYYNDKIFSGFQTQDRPKELQLLAGKAERFEKMETNPVGPGKYEPIVQINSRQGGFIGKALRKGVAPDGTAAPGPGAYNIEDQQKQPIQPKSKHPAIFGSGCVRFTGSSVKKQVSPGPGSYYIEKTNRKRRPRTINIRNVQSLAQTEIQQPNEVRNLMISPENMEVETVAMERGARNNAHLAQNSSFFSSSLRRFKQQKESDLGPGKYEVVNYLTHKTFNKRHELLGTASRFGKSKVQPKLGPGYYEVKQDLIRTKKVYDINLK